MTGRSPGGESGDSARIGVVEERHDRLVHAQTQVVAPLAEKRNAESGKYGRFAFTRGSASYIVKLPATIFGEDWVVLIGNSGVDWKRKSFRKRCQRLDRTNAVLRCCGGKQEVRFSHVLWNIASEGVRTGFAGVREVWVPRV